jgi:type VI secretion system secreted protein VgrG
VGGAAGVAGDLLTALTGGPPDEEADVPIVPGVGKGGPSSTNTEVFVFGDMPDGYAKGSAADNSPLTLHFRKWQSNEQDTQSITAIEPRRSIRPGKIELRDYNFRRPLLQHKAVLPPNGSIEASGGIVAPAPLEIYEHHGEYEKPDVSPQQALGILEQYRAGASLAGGRATSPRMLPGFQVQIADTPSSFGDGIYVPVRVRHEWHGTASTGTARREEAKTVDAIAATLHATLKLREVPSEEELRAITRDAMARAPFPIVAYQNRFEVIKSDLAFRPRRPQPVKNAVNESAFVVGPPGQATYMDKFGRIKVQFHWDRDGAYDANSSCWVRVVQPWAGTGYGFQFIPRIGMEVIVTFLGGDPDRPIVVGSVYNTTHPTPEPLPDRQTRSGIRTQTIPGGNGFNEISFEDQQGVERVYIHAQKDLHAVINDGHIVNVKGSETTTVSSKQQVAVGDQALRAVGGDQIDLAGGNRTEQVQGNHVHRVALDRRERIEGSHVLEVKGVRATDVAGDDVKAVHGNQSVSVDGHFFTNVGGSSPETKGSVMTHVVGSSYLGVSDRIVLDSIGGDNGTITLTCGESSIEITKDSIDIKAKKIRIDTKMPSGGDDDFIQLRSHKIGVWAKTGMRINGGDQTQSHIQVDGDAVQIAGGGDVVASSGKGAVMKLAGDVAKLYGPSEVDILGPAINLKPGSESGGIAAATEQDESDTPQTAPLKLLFTHTAKDIGEPIKSAKYILRATAPSASGKDHMDTKSGSTTDAGLLDTTLNPNTKHVHVTIFVNELSDYQDVYPEPLEWDLHIVDDMGAATSLAGARRRLQNLGFMPGPDDPTVTDIANDPLTAQAVTNFQRQYWLETTGKLDGTVPATLQQVYERTYTPPPPGTPGG